MKRISTTLSLAGLLLGAGGALAEFTVLSSTPANGQVGVALSGTVSFTFSAPLDTSARFGESPYPLGLLSPDPATPITIAGVEYSADLQTASFQVTHAPDTDFVWLLIGARSAAGEPLAEPLALNYTTAASAGPRSVSGRTTLATGDMSGVLVALLPLPLFSEEDSPVLVATVASAATGEYLLAGVRDGVCWPVAARDTDRDGVLDPSGVDLLGFYDPAGDGQPDSIRVAGSDVVGIDMRLLQLFQPVTARSYLQTATQAAQQLAPDQELRAVVAHSETVGLDGASPFWGYQFYSAALGTVTQVVVSGMGVEVDTAWTEESGPPPGRRALPADFADSDVAMAAAEAGGGAVFRARYGVTRSTLYGGNPWWAFPDDPEAAAPQGFSLAQGYPNPFNAATTLAFTVPHAARVRLQVFDGLGREVATLVDGAVSPGRHAVRFAPTDLATGVYFCRLQAEGFVQTRRLVLAR
ncbi:MAG: T9SS type A sorting domain-containing protein [Candidatus Latescibacterota bacterium]